MLKTSYKEANLGLIVKSKELNESCPEMKQVAHKVMSFISSH
jgi:hypothetical protein